MSRSADPKSSRWLGRIKKSVLVLLYGFILYVLSFGPAVRVFNTTENERLQESIAAFYGPLQWIRWKLRFSEQLEWWVNLWNPPDPPRAAAPDPPAP